MLIFNFISNYPTTLACDADVLIHTKGFTLKATGIADMFPHMAHMESMVWFKKESI